MILITICARGGSKGIPGKNIKLLNDIPLIAYTIKHAIEFQRNNPDVYIALSTDSNEIISVASKFGLTTQYLRPTRLGGDAVGKIEVIEDVLQWYEVTNNCKFDYVLDLDITSPIRDLNDLNAAYDLIRADLKALNIFSVNKSHRNPYFNMVEEGDDGFFHLVKNKENGFLNRQSTPKVYDLNASFYIYKRAFFDSALKSPITDCSLIYIMPHICFDLDEIIDFEFLAYLVENKKIEL